MIKVTMALVSTALGLMLTLSFKSHSARAPRSALTGISPGRPSPSEGGRGPTRARGGRPPRASARPASRSGSFAGKPISTPYGTMRVAAVIRQGRLTDVRVLQKTDGARSHEIDAGAIPVLRSEALSAHNANIDVVSGATFTSEGYAKSLQSALDKAGI
jgi:uncharacterized protein with FMN-binding domain